MIVQKQQSTPENHYTKNKKKRPVDKEHGGKYRTRKKHGQQE